MTDNAPPEASGPGGGEEGAAQPQPWFPPSGQPGGYAEPPPFDYGQAGGTGQAPPGSYGQPGAHGQPGAQGQPGSYGPPGSYGQQAWGAQRPYSPWPGQAPAPKPGVIPLRPLGVGEILDGAFTSIRRNPRATLGVAALLLTGSAVITTVVSLILVHYLGSVTLPSPGEQLTNSQATHLLTRLLEVLAPTAVLSIVLAFIVDTVLTGLLTVVIGRSVLGHKVTAGEAWRVARPRLPALIGATLLIPLVLIGVWAVYLVLLGILAAAHAPGGLIGGVAVLGGIAAVVLTVWFAIMFRMAAPAVVLEREGPARSLARSWRLVRGSFWRVFGISLLAGLIVLVTAGVLQIPFTLLAAMTGGGSSLLPGTGTASGILISAVGGVVAGAVARPISAGVAVLLYVDLRMRREGLDLVLQTAAGGGPAGDEFASLWRPGARGGNGAGPVPPPGPGAPPSGPGVPPSGPGVPPGGGPPTW